MALWDWGVKHLHFEGRRFTEDHLARYLWPEKKLKLSRRGLQFYRGLYYFGTKLKEQEWYLRALMEKREFSVRFHPEYLSDLLLIADDQRGTMLKLPVSRRSEHLTRRSLWELVALENQKDRQNEAAKWDNLDTRLRMGELTTKEVSSAKARAKKLRDPSISTKERIRSVKANRQAELADMTVEAVLGHAGMERNDVVDVTPHDTADAQDNAIELVDELLFSADNNN